MEEAWSTRCRRSFKNRARRDEAITPGRHSSSIWSIIMNQTCEDARGAQQAQQFRHGAHRLAFAVELVGDRCRAMRDGRMGQGCQALVRKARARTPRTG